MLSHLERELAVCEIGSTILDGELYCHGWSLQRINSAVAVKRLAPTPDTPLVEYHVFDCVKFGVPFVDRYSLIRGLLAPSPNIVRVRVVPTHLVQTQTEADNHFESNALQGYEGSVYRMGDNLYTRAGIDCNQANRTHSMLKRKAWKDDDFRVVDVLEGNPTDKGGKYVGSLGAFLLETCSGKRFSAAPAFTDQSREHYWTSPPIGKLAIVKYLTLSDDGIPRHPIVRAIREA